MTEPDRINWPKTVVGSVGALAVAGILGLVSTQASSIREQQTRTAETINRLAEAVNGLKTELAVMRASQKQIDDHEARLRALESGR